jgi:hypothetical protein
LNIGAALNEDREDQEDDGRDDEPELFLQGVLMVMVLMTFVVMAVMVLVGAALVVMMFM